MSELRVRQVRSSIGTKPKHRGTLRALGLGRIGKTNTLPDRPEIRGMIARVPHLVTVEEGVAAQAEASATKAPPAKASAAKASASKASATEAPAAKAPAARKKAAAKKSTAKKAAARKSTS
jgi:large subunit ribosomal protein L30